MIIFIFSIMCVTFQFISVSAIAFTNGGMPSNPKGSTISSLSTTQIVIQKITKSDGTYSFKHSEFSFNPVTQMLVLRPEPDSVNKELVVIKKSDKLMAGNLSSYFSTSNATTTGTDLIWASWLSPSTFYWQRIEPTKEYFISTNLPVYDADYVTILNPVAPPPYTGDDDYEKYKSGNYEGLLITNPYNDITQKVPKVDIEAHARIPISTTLTNAIYPSLNVFSNYLTTRKAIVDYCKENLQVFINNKYVDVIPMVEFNDLPGQLNFYNLTIRFSVQVTDPNNSIQLKSTFKTGIGIDGALGSISMPYSDSVSINYTKFISQVTTVVSEDGKTTTTTTTQANGINFVESITKEDDGSVITINNYGTEIIDPSGIRTYTPNPLTVIPSDDYLPLMEQIQQGFDRVTDLMVYGLHSFVSIPEILYNALINVFNSFGDLLPMAKEVFSFFPVEVNSIIIAVFGFLGWRVGMNVFGKR